MQTAATWDRRGASRAFVDTNVVIQPLAAADLPAVRSLLVDLPVAYPGAEAWLRRRLQDCLAGRARCMIAATADDVVGVTILTPKSLATKLSTIYVRPDFRRTHLGSRLLDQVLQDASRWAPRDAQGEIYVTIAHQTWGQLERLLSSRGFTRTAFESNRYGRGRHEIVATRLG
ncbi:GNAT family N-acetyltransferase [Cellulomonas sp. NPDC057328]|uniref:GNAT family N-acetyltransferase n=1 Tax=Cellulomonas sp. NPDC057328 TaxID=3346101 RepID=UPI0036428726